MVNPKDASPPDWKSFGIEVMEGWPDWAGESDIMGPDEITEIALKFNILRRVPGGFDPEKHDAQNGSERPGDPWIEDNF